ncbi:MAG: Gfo/Idh/MocA family oxidoreductase [Candidatus Hydrogenedentes bacterium]|nr:Gfo/Idh/MocA family oxidoreductase [Candidatus Hydrogenedentota bacterium]
MQNVRVGVIGVGHLGYHHARLYSELEGCELVGICDTDPERGAQVAAEFEVPCFATPGELAQAGLNAVSVATPTRYHRDIAVQMLNAGVDTLVEKPIAGTVAEAREIVEVAAKQNRMLQVGHVERFNGAVIALMNAFQQPKFIECHRLSPYPSRGTDVSVVHDLMIHDLEIVLAMDGSEVTSVDSVGVSVFSETEDIANTRLRFASGCVANLTASRVSMDSMRKIRIFEENAYVSTDYSEQQVLVYRKKPGTLAPGVSPMEMISIEPLELTREEPLRLELEAFLECVRNRTRPVVAGEDGLKALELAERIIHSMRDQP